MSFILDALRKSETERQEQSSAGFASVPTTPGRPSPARWLWLLAALLLVNFGVLLAVLLQPGSAPEPTAVPAQETSMPLAAPPARSATPPSFADQVATVIRERPATDTSTGTGTASGDSLTAAEPGERSDPPPAQAIRPTSSVPHIDQLRLDGLLNLPELHLDIHVFSEQAAERFVFINMDKYREGDRIDEGPVVHEITPDGVVLDHQGQAFLLPRK